MKLSYYCRCITAFPDAPVYLGSLFPMNRSYSLSLFLLGAAIEVYIVSVYLSLLSMILNFTFTLVPNLIFWLREIRMSAACSRYTIGKLREPSHALHAYRSLHLIVQLCNDLFTRARIDVMHMVCIAVAVISNVILIRYHVRFLSVSLPSFASSLPSAPPSCRTCTSC